ncbi:MAG TPA: EAL domain-containing protein [Mycobacteriales bacterium]|nr:EAL domain-containing protein [Mycobacteriales bacterium]
MPLSADMERVHRIRELVEQLINDPRQLGPNYEPIVRLADRKVVGVKATGRGAPGTELADTLSLLDGARSLGLVERLDWAFRAMSFDDLHGRDDLELHLTPEPETFGTACPPRFAASVSRGRRELTVAAELHADSFGPGVTLNQGLSEIREWGWRVVLADVADDPAAVDGAAAVGPDIVQIDLRLPRRSPGALPLGSRRLLSMAADTGAQVMALGVDTEAARAVALDLGCVLARGALFGRPGPLPQAGITRSA